MVDTSFFLTAKYAKGREVDVLRMINLDEHSTFERSESAWVVQFGV